MEAEQHVVTLGIDIGVHVRIMDPVPQQLLLNETDGTVASHAEPEVPVSRCRESGIKTAHKVEHPPREDRAATPSAYGGLLQDQIPIDVSRSTLQHPSGQFVAIGVYLHDAALHHDKIGFSGKVGHLKGDLVRLPFIVGIKKREMCRIG